ncbi:hypothetical protein BH23ACT11_BH23ACT11_14540 [soil metagenome]
MVPVIGECGVDLPEIQVRMLEVQLFRTQSISLLLDDQFHYLRRSTGKNGNMLIVYDHMFITSLHHSFVIPQAA